MSRLILKVVVLLCILTALGGCTALLPQDDSRTPNEVSLNPSPAVQTGDFNYSGPIGLFGIGEGCVRNISVVLYDASETRIDSTYVGTLCFNDEAPKSKNISINATTQPVYIIIESPDFWDGNTPAYPTGLIRDPELDLYDAYPIEEQGQIRPQGVHQRTTANTTSLGYLTYSVAYTADDARTTRKLRNDVVELYVVGQADTAVFLANGFYAVENGVERGFGWESMERKTPGISEQDTNQILRTPNIVENHGPTSLVVGIR